MIKAEWKAPDLDAWIERIIAVKTENALGEADEVALIVIDHAVNQNQDKNGLPMPPKKRDDGKPPLTTDENRGEPHMMSLARWHIEEIDKKSVRVEYTPPSYFQYVVKNGREWISKRQWNPNAKLKIKLGMLRKFLYGS